MHKPYDVCMNCIGRKQILEETNTYMFKEIPKSIEEPENFTRDIGILTSPDFFKEKEEKRIIEDFKNIQFKLIEIVEGSTDGLAVVRHTSIPKSKLNSMLKKWVKLHGYTLDIKGRTISIRPYTFKHSLNLKFKQNFTSIKICLFILVLSFMVTASVFSYAKGFSAGNQWTITNELPEITGQYTCNNVSDEINYE